MSNHTPIREISMRSKINQISSRWPRKHLKRIGIFLPLAATVGYLMIFYIYPMARMFSLSVYDPEFTLEHYRHFIDTSIYFGRMAYTFRIALSVTLLCILLGYPIAYLLTIVAPRIRNVLLTLVIISVWISILVRTYAWMVILGRFGLVNQTLLDMALISSPIKLLHNAFGLHVGMVHVLLPYAILPMYSVMSGIDKNLVKAAQNLGANSFQAFRKIFVPLSLPGVAGSAFLTFMFSLGFYITPALLGGPSDIMIANLIHAQVTDMVQWGFGSAMSVMVLLFTLLVFYIYNRYLGLDQLLGGL